MTTDYHAEAREVARYLEMEGFGSEAGTLREAIESGSTGTEILMALRWHLQRMDRSVIGVSAEARQRIQALALAIDTALGS